MKKELSGIALAVLLSGCASTSVDYITDATGENTTADITSIVTTTEDSETQSGDLDASKWIEKIKAVSADGHEYTFAMNAEIIDPEEEICIYEFEAVRSMTPEQKKQIAEGIFGADSVYLYDDEYIPKKDLEGEINRVNELIATEPSSNKDTIESLLEYIDELNAKIEVAPADRVKADDFSGNHYSGYINGIPHTLEFRLGDDGDFFGSYSNKFSYQLEENCILLMPNFAIFPEVDYDKYRITVDEAIAQSEELMKNMGFEDFAIRRENRSSDNYVYSVEYVQGLGCVNRGVVYTVPFRETDRREPDLSGVRGNSIHMDIYRSFIIATICSPYYLYDITKDVQLISLNEIKEIIKDEFAKHPENYIRVNYNDEICYTKLIRSYIEVASDDSKRVSMVPCWALYSTSFPAVFVNALDGTIIENMLYVGEDGERMNI